MPEVNTPFLSIVIPAYNEERRLPSTLRAIDNYLKQQNYNYEIIVVNDGSIDKTEQVLLSLKSQISNLRIINNKINKGKGAVVKQGMLASTGRYRLFTDADNSTPIEQAGKILFWLEKGYDVVIGSRDIKGAVLNPPQPFLRRLSGQLFRLFRKFVLDLWKIRDTQCGFKAFSMKAADDIFSRLKTKGFLFDVEALLLAKKLGYRIKEVGIYWKNDLESKVTFRSAIEMGIGLFRLRRQLSKKGVLPW